MDETTHDPGSFEFSSLLVAAEMYFVIYEELIQSFALALVAVARLSLLILGDVAMVALICITMHGKAFLLLYIYIMLHISRYLVLHSKTTRIISYYIAPF